MADAPVIFFEWAETWRGPDGTEGATLYVMVPTGEGNEVRSQIVGHLRECGPRSAVSLRQAFRSRHHRAELRPQV